MKKYWKLFWLILTVSLLAAGCTKDKMEPAGIEIAKGLPDEQSDGVNTITLNGNIVSMEMHARHIDRYYKKKETYIDSLFVKKFDEKGDLNSTLTCEKAKIDEATNIIVCEGNVVIVSDNGILRTPLLTWNRDTDGIIAENGFVMERGDDILRGDMMKTDMNMDKLEIINVSAEGKVKSGKVEW
ncbi:MAG: LPS export ABC transporter periplasmic protein LptC [Candidatus Cloacimonetes bacterium]|nr:LPS export ABC transporter periplasmic protein LptC [Candidatus Cloacimonadota bacterium]